MTPPGRRASERAEWVSAPTEMKSTPVSAIGADGLERDAAGGLELGPPGDERDRVAQSRRAHVVEQDARRRRRRAPRGPRRASPPRPRPAAPLRSASAASAAAIPPARRRWLSLTRIASSRPTRWLRAAAAADGVLLERAQAGRRLARVEDGRARAVDRVDVAARERRDAAQAAEQVERRRARRSAPRARGPSIRRSPPASPSRASPSASTGSTRTGGRARGRPHRRPATPQTTPGSSSSSSARQRSPRRHERLGRQVAGADVLGERRGGNARRRLLRSAPSLAPRLLARSEDDVDRDRRSSVGKSSRKWPPRLSVASARCSAISRARGWGASSRRSSPSASRIRPASCQSARRTSSPGGPVSASTVVASSRRQPGLAERGERGPAAEDEAFEQRVRGETVRAVDAGAGALAGRVEARHGACARRGR